MTNNDKTETQKPPEITSDNQKKTRRNPIGLCVDLEGALARPGFSVSAEDIDEVRREMWANFPRDDF